MVAQSTRKSLPKITLNGQPDKAILLQYVDALSIDPAKPTIFRRDQSLCRIQAKADQSLYLQNMAIDDALYVMEHATETLRIVASDTGKPRKSIHASVPKNIAALLLASDNHFPAIRGVSHVPILRSDGSFVTAPGYDPQTQMLYDPPVGFQLPEVPDRPSQEDAQQAAAKILDLLCDFPFVSEADRANALGLGLTFLMRHALGGPVPIAIVDAISNVGTGKTLLSKTLMSMILGKMLAPHSMPSDDTEMSKTLMSIASEGATVAFFDNAKGIIGSASLEAAITAEGINNRLLGRNSMQDLPLICTWLLTTNGAHLSGDMNRRAYPILIDAQQARAYTRTAFKYDLPDYAIEHHAEYLAAFMTMIRAWFVAECPSGKPNAVMSGTFGKFVTKIGGVLEYAGIPAFLNNVESNMARQNDDDQQWADHLASIYAEYGDLPFTTKALLVAYGLTSGEGKTIDTIATSIPDSLISKLDLNRTDQAKASTVGKFFAYREGRRFGSQNMMLAKGGIDRTNKTTWKILVGGSTQSPDPLPRIDPKAPACPHCQQRGQPSVVKLRNDATVEYFFVCNFCHETFKQY